MESFFASCPFDILPWRFAVQSPDAASSTVKLFRRPSERKEVPTAVCAFPLRGTPGAVRNRANRPVKERARGRGELNAVCRVVNRFQAPVPGTWYQCSAPVCRIEPTACLPPAPLRTKASKPSRWVGSPHACLPGRAELPSTWLTGVKFPLFIAFVSNQTSKAPPPPPPRNACSVC